MRIIESIENGEDPDTLKTDVHKIIRDQIDAHNKQIGLRKFVRFKGNAVHLRKISVRPELVEGLWLGSWWFDKLTTNG